MEKEVMTTSAKSARRLFIVKQNLTGETRTGGFREKIIGLVRDIGYIQWDPVTVVAPSHMISLWSRIGSFDWSDLEKLMWIDKDAFLHWTPTAVIVLTEDYPLFYSLMKCYPESLGRSWASHITTANRFLQSHQSLKEQVLDKLREGPAEIKQFRDYGKRRKSDDGWSTGNEVSTLLFHLHMMGEVMVSGHVGNQNLWSLSEEFLPGSVKREVLPLEELETLTAERSIRALGIAGAYDINRYFIRGRYRNLENALNRLEEEGKILRIKIDGEKGSRKQYIHYDDVKQLESVDKDRWDFPLQLISPFDNLISIRERTRRMFHFEYILEQFIPKEKRKFGTYVLPVLWRGNLVGRIDAKLDKESKILNVNAVYAEHGYENDIEIPLNLNEKVGEFAEFLGAAKTIYGKQKPDGWSRYLK